MAEKAMEAGGQDYKIFVPIQNALGPRPLRPIIEVLRDVSGAPGS